MRCAIVASLDEEGAGDLVGRQPADQPQRQRRARLARQRRVAGDEDQAQELVADVVVDRRLDVLASRRRPPRARGRSRRACARASGRAGSRRSPAASPPPSARRPGCAAPRSAATRRARPASASCASSSAVPTSRTMRARPADQPRPLDAEHRLDRLMGVRVAMPVDRRSRRSVRRVARPRRARGHLPVGPRLQRFSVFSRTRSWIASASGVMRLGEVAQLVERADLDLARPEHRVRAALRPTRPPRPGP